MDIQELTEGNTFRHVKRGSEYRVLAIYSFYLDPCCTLNDDDIAPVFSYLDDDGEDGYSLMFYADYAHSNAMTSSGFVYTTINKKIGIDSSEYLQDYTFHGDAKIQTEKPLTGSIDLVIYQDVKTLDFYARPFLEFMGGRFVKVDENERLAQCSE